ncbi:AIR synthase related protein, partial [Vibrio hepatarius]|uniref:AIR synthase related protein n=2 Tax=Vibrio oreintalis group TaxID=1891919 RepID=UPI002FD8FF1F
MSGEFNLIEKYFVNRQKQRKDVILAAGDDCALVKVPENLSVAISTDTLVAGTHFLSDADPAWVAHKALASNISDLAAMGATPSWVSLALTMPEPDEAWLAPFCNAFFELADYYGIQLIGGDTTKGPLSITLTVQGLVDADKALRRDGAQVG